MRKIIALAMLMGIVLTSHSAEREQPAKSDSNILLIHHTNRILGGDWDFTEKLNLKDIESNSKQPFETLRKKLFEAKLPLLLAIYETTFFDSTQKRIIDIVELLRNSYHTLDTFSSTSASHEAIETALKEAPKDMLSSCFKAIALYPSKENEFFDTNIQGFTRKLIKVDDKPVNFTIDDISDLSCTLAIMLYNDYSQVSRLAKFFYDHSIETHDKGSTSRAKFWLKKRVDREQDINAMKKLAHLYKLENKGEKAKKYLQLANQQS